MRRNSGETFTVDHKRIQGQVQTHGSTKDENIYPSGTVSSKDGNDYLPGNQVKNGYECRKQNFKR